MLLDELPTENTTNGASQITETADDVLSASQDSFWPSSPAQSLASTATATAGQLASPASFDSFSTSFTTSEYEFDGGDGAEELHADLFYASTALATSHNSDPPRLETEDSGSFIDPRRVLHGKRTREDVEDEQDEEFSRPGSKYRRMSISTINIDHAYADQIQPHDAATAGEERSKPEESFDIGDYLHLPMIHATAEDVGVTLLDGQDSEPSILPTQHLPNASWKNFLNPVVPDEPVQYSASPHPHDGQHFKAEQQPLTPDFRGLEQGVYSDHDRTTVSPRNLHIQDVQDVSVYKAEPLFYNSQDEPHALSMHKSHDGEQNLKHEFQEDSFGSPYGYTSSESYYSVGETDHPQSHHEPYHYPQPPQTNQQLQAARVQSAGSDTSSRVLLPMAATPHASFSAPMSCMEINAAQTDFGPRNFAMSSPRNSPSGSSAHHQEHHEYHGIVGTNTVSRRQPSSRSSSKSDAERANKDRMLLNLRSQGYTYQEIRRRCRFTEAESTLRGRYRLLTKRKEERVRKPQWTAYDDELLLSIVNSLAGDRQVGRDFRVAWKTVADSIVEGGGSYHFGNTTCRKRYDELMERQAVIKEEQSE
ncbi:hypothetical protein SEPCBS119000_003205 [Sporothrix epigloea]|uniref:Myb-like domain-containing protein n=1 Tax=Sporothrix epigloea TaxID=1892477 RepID=A0ABP0DKC4_9PEZI